MVVVIGFSLDGPFVGLSHGKVEHRPVPGVRGSALNSHPYLNLASLLEIDYQQRQFEENLAEDATENSHWDFQYDDSYHFSGNYGVEPCELKTDCGQSEADHYRTAQQAHRALETLQGAAERFDSFELAGYTGFDMVQRLGSFFSLMAPGAPNKAEVPTLWDRSRLEHLFLDLFDLGALDCEILLAARSVDGKFEPTGERRVKFLEYRETTDLSGTMRSRCFVAESMQLTAHGKLLLGTLEREGALARKYRAIPSLTKQDRELLASASSIHSAVEEATALDSGSRDFEVTVELFDTIERFDSPSVSFETFTPLSLRKSNSFSRREADGIIRALLKLQIAADLRSPAERAKGKLAKEPIYRVDVRALRIAGGSSYIRSQFQNGRDPLASKIALKSAGLR